MMDNYTMELFKQMHDLMHRIEGRIDAMQDLKPNLRLTLNDEPKVLLFPMAKKEPDSVESGEKISTLEEVNKMLVELKIKLKARERSDGRFEIRPHINGVRTSIYGYSAEEIAKKYKLAIKGKPIKKPQKTCVTLYQWFDEWLEVYKKPNVKEKTFYSLKLCVKNYVKKLLPDKPLNRFTITELTKALNSIESTRMRQYLRGTLKDAFSCAVVAGKIKSSPAEHLQAVKHIVQKGKAFALLDLIEMIERAAPLLAENYLHYYLFCLFAGTRREEAAEAMGEDCDFKNKILHIRGTKTEGSKRRIPMFPILEKIILKQGVKKGSLFNVSNHRASVYFKDFRGDHTDAVPHWLRHTFGTIQICVLGVPTNTVALWMGHSDPATTMRIYTHPEDLAPDVYFSGTYSEEQKKEILLQRYNKLVKTVERILNK